MRTRQTNAPYHADRYSAAAKLAGRINAVRPMVTTYGFEARAGKRLGDCETAADLYFRVLGGIAQSDARKIQWAVTPNDSTVK